MAERNADGAIVSHPGDASGRERGRRGLSVTTELARFGVPVLLILLIIVFSSLSPDAFFTLDNLKATLATQSVLVLLALAAMVPFVVGEFDLSPAANASLANVVCAGFIINQGGSTWLAIVLALLASTIVGFANGLVVVKLRVPALIATLAMATVLEGVQLLYTGGGQILGAPESLTQIARSEVLYLPAAVVYAAAVAVVAYVVLDRRVVGRRLYAVGGNRRAAELSGVPVQRYVVGAFTGAGVLAGIGGVILASRLGNATVGSADSLLLSMFAAVFLGATTITPGRYNVPGTVVAVLFLAVALSGMQYLGAPVWSQPLFNGLVLIAAVSLSAWMARRNAAAARKEQLELLSADE